MVTNICTYSLGHNDATILYRSYFRIGLAVYYLLDSYLNISTHSGVSRGPGWVDGQYLSPMANRRRAATPQWSTITQEIKEFQIQTVLTTSLNKTIDWLSWEISWLLYDFYGFLSTLKTSEGMIAKWEAPLASDREAHEHAATIGLSRYINNNWVWACEVFLVRCSYSEDPRFEIVRFI